MSTGNRKISQFINLETASNEDLLAIVDVSEPNVDIRTKKITFENLLKGVLLPLDNYYTKTESDNRYLQSFTESDPVFQAWLDTDPLAGFVTGTPWQDEGYLTSYTETDPVFSQWLIDTPPLYSFTEEDPIFTNSVAYGITDYDIASWDEAYGWGNHALAGYLTSETDPVFNAWILATPPLYSEADTLQTVTDRGATTTNEITAKSFIKTGGTSSQFLKADGSSDSTAYLPTATASSTYVPYSGATGAVNLGANNLTVDTNTLFVDATNDRVGIGTNTPSSKLTLYDDTVAYNLEFQQYGYNNNGIIFKSNSYTKFSAGIKTTDAATFSRRGLAFFTGDNADGTTDAQERMRITRSGNVGIGTTAPLAKLDIYSATSGVLGNLRVYDSTAMAKDVGGKIAFSGNYKADGSTLSSWAMIGGLKEDATEGSYLGYLSFQTRPIEGLTERMRITSAGNAGIGTTAPAYLLDVRGALNTYALQLSPASVGYANGWTGLNIGSLNATSGETARLNFKGLSTDGNDNSLARISALIESRTSAYTLGALAFYTHGGTGGVDTPTERVRITSAGNVGIGTIAPAEKLEIDGNLFLNGDNDKIYLGTAKDASIYYDGTNMVINPKVVGSGILDVAGVLQTDGYNSSDGTAGLTATKVFLDGDGVTTNTVTIKDGLITAWTQI